MNEYDFLLTFVLAADDRDHNDIVEHLGEVGCTDATVGIGVLGMIALDLDSQVRLFPKS